MIPGENEWTVIFSRNSTSWGSFTYNQAEDALRVTVKPQATDFHEALTYDFDDVNPDSTVVTLRWEKVAVPFKVGVNTHEIVAQNLHNQLRGLAQYTWEGWDDAANYLLQEKIDLDEALTVCRQIDSERSALRQLHDQVASSRRPGPERGSHDGAEQGADHGQRHPDAQLCPPVAN